MRNVILGGLMLAVPVAASAHVGVRPRESTPGVEERYTVRVPTEGAITTTSVHLEIPDGVTVLEVLPADGVTFETQKHGDRIATITWKKEIKPKEIGEFVFRARNPQSGTEIRWKAHQHFADGTVTAWVEPAGGKRPGPVTKLVAAESPSASGQAIGDAAAIETWVNGYDAASLRKISRRCCSSREEMVPGRFVILKRRAKPDARPGRPFGDPWKISISCSSSGAGFRAS